MCFRALLHFLDPDKFRVRDDFAEKYKNLKSVNGIEVLRHASKNSFSLLERSHLDVEALVDFALFLFEIPDSYICRSLRVCMGSFDLIFSAESSEMWRSHCLQKLSAFWGWRCHLFRDGEPGHFFAWNFRWQVESLSFAAIIWISLMQSSNRHRRVLYNE